MKKCCKNSKKMMNRACDPKLVNAEFADLMLSIFGKTPKTSDLIYTGDFRGFSIKRESLIYYSNYRNYKSLLQNLSFRYCYTLRDLLNGGRDYNCRSIEESIYTEFDEVSDYCDKLQRIARLLYLLNLSYYLMTVY